MIFSLLLLLFFPLFFFRIFVSAYTHRINLCAPYMSHMTPLEEQTVSSSKGHRVCFQGGLSWVIMLGGKLEIKRFQYTEFKKQNCIIVMGQLHLNHRVCHIQSHRGQCDIRHTGPQRDGVMVHCDFFQE